MDEKVYLARQVFFDFQCDQNAMDMPLAGTGRHCVKCDKVLTDFTGWKGEDIFIFLRDKPTGSVCGFFKKGQIQEDIVLTFEEQYEKLDFTRQFFFILLFVFGTSLFSFSDVQAQTQPGKKTEKTQAKRPIQKKKTSSASERMTSVAVKATYMTKREVAKTKKIIYAPETSAGIVINDAPPIEEVKKHESDNTPLNIPDSLYTYAEIMPEFYGGYGSMMHYISTHIFAPTDAREWGEIRSGKVYVQFVVEKDGSITNEKIVKSLNPALDKEALRVIKNMPGWKPGEFNGNRVRVRFVLPIKFNLQ